jgi:hypothetical protein
MRFWIGFSLIGLMFIGSWSYAQNDTLTFSWTNPPTVQNGGNALPLAWLGGLDYGAFNALDINCDGRRDLLVFDKTGNRLLPLIHQGGTGDVYQYEPQWAKFLPPMQSWVVTRDFNNDGRMDIFCHTNAGIMVYKNESSPGNLAFAPAISTAQVYSDYGGSSPVNLYVSSSDIPAIEDLDGDGDLDIAVFGLLGSTIEFHQNQSMERFGHADSLDFVMVDRCFGNFTEGFSNNSIFLDSCMFNVQSPGTDASFTDAPVRPSGKIESELEADERSSGYRHAGSTLLALDLEGNGLMDLLIGDISFTNVVALTNTGTLQSAYMGNQDTAFPSSDIPVDVQLFPAMYYTDVDNDGIKELIVGPNSPNNAKNYANTWLYENTGTNAAPVFQRASTQFIHDQTLDVGKGCYPALLDANGDGLMDIVIGNYGLSDGGTGTYLTRLTLLTNTGTNLNPSFAVTDTNFAQLASLPFPVALAPTFGDINGDGLPDMILGDEQGKLHAFSNTGSVGQASFSLSQQNFQGIDVGNYAAPQLFDLNRDGLLDLIIGEFNGNLNYYQNVGTSQAPSYSLITDSLGGILLQGIYGSVGISRPFFFEQSNGNFGLIVGTNGNHIHQYGSIDGNLNGLFLEVDTQLVSYDLGRHLSPVLYDFNGDGRLDLVAGNEAGGLYYLRGIDPDELGASEYRNGVRTACLYPNPASNVLHIQLPADWLSAYELEKGVNYRITNGLGKQIQKGLWTGQALDVAPLPHGWYILELIHPQWQSINRFFRAN